MNNLTITKKDPYEIWTLHTEGKLNSLSDPVLDDLETAIQQTTASVVIITGKEVFCTGANIEVLKKATAEEFKHSLEHFTTILNSMEQKPTIFIAAVNKYALGGGLELAMACDIILASDDAQLGLPEINLGVLPGADGIKRMFKLIGKKHTEEIVLEGKPVTAQRAYQLGLIDEVVAHDQLLTRAITLAQDLMEKNPAALHAIKKLVQEAGKKDISAEEIEAFIACFNTDDAKKRIQDFLRQS